MEDSSYDINIQNEKSVQRQINEKNSCSPFFATIRDASQTITDYDTFPYPRWFRGVPQSNIPIIAEREAGWRTRHDNCYKITKPVVCNDNTYPNHCFQGPCNLVVPCYPDYLQKYGDKDAINVTLNKACTVQYR